jgi:DNA-binding CsgD family transcriptional regulator/GAF domain-containing protein
MSRGDRPASRPDEVPDGRDAEPAPLLLQRARRLLDLVAMLANERDLPSGGMSLDLRSADDSLRAATRLVVRRISRRECDSDEAAGAEFAVVLLQLADARAALKDTELARRSAAVSVIQGGLQRLRSAGSVEQLAGLVPQVVHELGFHRVLLSRLHRSRWIARSAFAPDDTGLADAMVRVGAASPGRLDSGWPEGDVVRRRTPILVPDAQGNPRVHPQLKTLTGSRDYISAPLVAGGDVVGLLHVDRSARARPLADDDRDLLGLFAEGLGFVFERTVCQEQLIGLKRRLEEQARSVGDLMDSYLDADLLGPPVGSTAGPRPAPPFPVSGPLAALTRRELEVLWHLADGESNHQISARLFISPDTVKTHVKHLLNKLGAANRAEAVARYHQLTR